MEAFNSLPNVKFFDITKLKACVDDKLNVAKMMISLFDRIEDTMGKGENAGYQHFLLFPRFFEAFSFGGSLKAGIVWSYKGRQQKLLLTSIDVFYWFCMPNNNTLQAVNNVCLQNA